MHSFEVAIRISQSSKVMFTEANITVLGLTNPDVNLKRMHQLFSYKTLSECLSFPSFIKSIFIFINLLESDVLSALSLGRLL